jgi:hypothetical protein
MEQDGDNSANDESTIWNIVDDRGNLDRAGGIDDA